MTEIPGDGDTERTTFVGPAAAEAKLAKLGALPGMAARVAAIRAGMDGADRAAAEEQEYPCRDAG